MLPRIPSHEALLGHFRTRRGLYILGAGASTGLVPFGASFLGEPALDYLRNLQGFSADIPWQSELTRRSVATVVGDGIDSLVSRLFPDRVLRPGSIDFQMYREILQRQPNLYTRLHMQHVLAGPRFRRQQSESYLAFRIFHPAAILNYNLDGLASDACDDVHNVIAAHGTVAHGYGAPEIAKLLVSLREYDLPVPLDDLLLCLPESDDDHQLKRRLSKALRPSPQFVALIGYSFGRNGDTYDDHVSWATFCREFRSFPGNIYVIEPKPDDLRERIAEEIQSKSVFGVRAYWNVLAHAFTEASGGHPGRKSLNYVCERILDTLGDRVTFPR